MADNLDNVRNEIKELIDIIINNDTYLKNNLKLKNSLNYDYLELSKSLDANKENKVVYDILKSALLEMDSRRGKDLMKKYGKLIFRERVYNNIMGIKND